MNKPPQKRELNSKLNDINLKNIYHNDCCDEWYRWLDELPIEDLLYGISRHSNKNGFGHQIIDEVDFKKLSNLICTMLKGKK